MTLHNSVQGVSPICAEAALYGNVLHVTLYQRLCLLAGLGILLVVISGDNIGQKSFITFYYCAV